MRIASLLGVSFALLLLACSDDSTATAEQTGAGGQAGTAGAGEAGVAGSAGPGGMAGQAQGGAGQGGEPGCPGTVESGTISEEDVPLSLVTDATHLYWSTAKLEDSGDYSYAIRRAPKDGGEPATLATTTNMVGAVALTSDSIVWVEVPVSGSGPSRLRKVPKGGGTPEQIVSIPSGKGQPDLFSLQTNQTDAFLMLRQFGDDFRYSIQRAPLAGGGSAEIASHTLPAGIDARSMILDGDELYWSFLSGWIYSTPIGVSAIQEASLLVDTMDGVEGWTLRGDDVLYLSAGKVLRVAKAGGEPDVLVSGAEGYRILSASASWLAWGSRDHTGAEQIRAQKDGGEVCVLATEGVVSAYSSLIDGDRFYWTNTASKKAGGAVRWVKLP